MVRPLKTKKKKNGSIIASLRMVGGLRQAALVSLPYVLALTAAGVLFGGVIAYAVNSSTFQLTEVKILNIGSMTQDQAFKFCELQRGENLIHLDLVSVQQVIKRNHPEFKEVRVRRVLPNRVEVLLKRRTPSAQLALSKYVQIDKDFVVLPGTSAAPFRNLLIVEGGAISPVGLPVGATVTDPATKKALKLAEIIKRSRVLTRHFLSKIDIADPKNISLTVDGVEIRIGSGHFLERLKILDQTLKTIDLDSSKIAYIDLRFDDVVIGPR